MFQNRFVTPDYFSSFNIPMLAGANLSQEQISNNDNHIVIDENMATMAFPGMPYQEIIGQTLDVGILGENGEVIPSIVNGIAANTQNQIGRTEPVKIPTIYTGQMQMGQQLAFTVEMPKGKTLTAEMLFNEVAKKFPRLTNLQVTSLHERWNRQTLSERLSLWVVLTMTALTLLLAAIGVSGLTQMTTNQRKYELAVRMATGAKQARLVGFILKDALWMLVIGLGLGFVVSVFGYQQLQQQLTMLPAFDWLTMSALDVGLISIVLLSVITPAWRVISADPMQALREE